MRQVRLVYPDILYELAANDTAEKKF